MSILNEKLYPNEKSNGATTGLGIMRFWSFLFTENEDRQRDKRQTDTQILADVKKEFPTRDLNYFANDPYIVSRMRSMYNRGKLPMDGIDVDTHRRPVVKSNRYNSEGRAVAGKSSRPIQPKERGDAAST